MKIWLTVLIVGLCGAYALWDTRRPMPSHTVEAETQPMAIAPKQPLMAAPDFTFQTLDGRAVSLADLRGKTVIVNFWATWCAPCIVEFPDLLRIADTRRADLVFVGISVDANANVITPFFKRFDAQAQTRLKLDNVYIAHDKGKAISQDLFQSVRYPETYIINPSGEIVRKIVGALTPDDIQSLLSAKNS